MSQGHPLQVVLLALYAAIYPTLLAVVLVLLSQPRRGRLLLAYLAGALTMSIGVGLLIVVGLKGSGAIEGSHSSLSWGADLALGALALLAALVLVTRSDERLRKSRPPRPEPRRDPWSQRILARGSVPIVFVAALGINLPGAAYLIALKDMAAAQHPAAVDILLVVGFNLIMFLLAELPALGLLRAPDRTLAVVEGINGWLAAHGRRIATVMLACFGVFLIARGVAHS